MRPPLLRTRGTDRRMRNFDVREVTAGVVFSGVGIFFLIAGWQLSLGSLARMGPGFFPTALSIVTIVVGLLIALRGLRLPEGGFSEIAWRPLLAVILGIAAFALVTARAGLVPGTFCAISIAAFGDRASRLPNVLLLAAGMGLAAWLIFLVALGLPIPAFRRFW